MGKSIPVDVKPEILEWAVRQIETDRLDEKLNSNIEQWINGTKKPTLSQITKLSKKTYIPFGYFFLDRVPQENIDLIEYRTVDSEALKSPSRNLIDTIFEMELVQDWMEEYYREMDYSECEFAGFQLGKRDIKKIADDIRNYLDIPADWFTKENSSDKAFRYWRDKINNTGIIVTMSGIVKNNTHRVLKTDEFKAFAMLNEFAPLIFINASDSKNGRLFSLLHEIVHIALGRDDLFNANSNLMNKNAVSDVERICNAVTAELLVPAKNFVEVWNKYDTSDFFEKCEQVRTHFVCSTTVIARRALDNSFIDDEIYTAIAQKKYNQYCESKENKRNPGGNYYNTMTSRLDKYFVRALCDSISSGRTSYIDALRLTNTKKEAFVKIAGKMGGVLI